jgi:hypothetical protein
LYAVQRLGFFFATPAAAGAAWATAEVEADVEAEVDTDVDASAVGAAPHMVRTRTAETAQAPSVESFFTDNLSM